MIGAQFVERLIFVSDLVDQTRLQRILRQERTIVHQRAQLRLRHLARLGNAEHDLLEEIAVQRLVHLLVRLGVGLLGVGVDGGLVVADVVHVGDDAELVERATQEECVGCDTRQVDFRGRHDGHAVRSRRKVVAAVVGSGKVGVDRFARRLEVEDRVAQFLHLAPIGRREAHGLEQHGANARVGLRLAKRIDERTNRRRPRPQEGDDVAWRGLLEIAADLEHQHGALRN